jgi:hypothetical protein
MSSVSPMCRWTLTLTPWAADVYAHARLWGCFTCVLVACVVCEQLACAITWGRHNVWTDWRRGFRVCRNMSMLGVLRCEGQALLAYYVQEHLTPMPWTSNVRIHARSFDGCYMRASCMWHALTVCLLVCMCRTSMRRGQSKCGCCKGGSLCEPRRRKPGAYCCCGMLLSRSDVCGVGVPPAGQFSTPGGSPNTADIGCSVQMPESARSSFVVGVSCGCCCCMCEGAPVGGGGGRRVGIVCAIACLSYLMTS